MSHFERTEGAEDNLGKNPAFNPTENFAQEGQLTPEEILMEIEDAKERGDLPEEIESVSLNMKDDFDDEPSNWEDDVNAGKYDEIPHPVDNVEVKISPVHEQSRRTIVEAEELMTSKERADKFWFVKKRNQDNSKPKRPQDNADSIRFDEAV